MGKEYNIASGSDKYENTSARDLRNTRTGYALRKFIQNDWNIDASIVNMKFPLIRLPEIMLISVLWLAVSSHSTTPLKIDIKCGKRKQ